LGKEFTVIVVLFTTLNIEISCFQVCDFKKYSHEILSGYFLICPVSTQWLLLRFEFNSDNHKCLIIHANVNIYMTENAYTRNAYTIVLYLPINMYFI
jgi:hypothetical protein